LAEVRIYIYIDIIYYRGNIEVIQQITYNIDILVDRKRKLLLVIIWYYLYNMRRDKRLLYKLAGGLI